MTVARVVRDRSPSDSAVLIAAQNPRMSCCSKVKPHRLVAGPVRRNLLERAVAASGYSSVPTSGYPAPA
ncbi:MAG: hypothetical protein QOE71_3815 [Pseudonocardiales bacterium]|jgi:hypothetical protein|nr:hypothetical protein [Pseudonocardiales bacterium]